MIDIHNHIIPGIDDGALDTAMALHMLTMAQEQGITHVVCTPHMHAGRYVNDAQTIKQAFLKLCQAVDHSSLTIELAMAAEVRISDEFMVQLMQGGIPFIGQWQGRSAVLLEMPHAYIPTGIEKLLDWLFQQNIQPIIAHPERNKEIIRSPQIAQPLADRGVLFQLTAGSVTGEFGTPVHSTAHWLLDQQLIHFMASDAHRLERRAPAMATARQAVSERYGETLATTLTVDHPATLTASLFAGSVE